MGISDAKNLWLIGAVIGTIIAILILSWCFLFVYFNICLSPTKTTSKTKDENRNTNQNNVAQILSVSKSDQSIQTNGLINISNDKDKKQGKMHARLDKVKKFTSAHVQTDAAPVLSKVTHER